MVSLRALDGKQIQKHLQPLAAQKVRIVKVLVSGFVVNHAEILPARLVENIHPVDKAGQHCLPLRRFDIDRRKRAVFGEGKLLIAGRKA